MGALGIAPQKGIVSPAYNVYVPCSRLDPRYIDRLVRTTVFAQEATRFSKGVWSSRLRLYPEGFFEIVFPVPPRLEQEAIVHHITKESTRLDGLAVVANNTVELLKERRKALITDAVAGAVTLGELHET
jgi:type I restriction enzyme S subunit